tara:strand:+ start:487 stop:702 length:216 start_codon:yes stop_codon:yes gene_type:complete
MVYVTRSGRTTRTPELYEPKELCEDDYSDGEDIEDEDLFTDDESDEDDDEDDADENGNLKGFVVDDEEEEA